MVAISDIQPAAFAQLHRWVYDADVACVIRDAIHIFLLVVNSRLLIRIDLGAKNDVGVVSLNSPHCIVCVGFVTAVRFKTHYSFCEFVVFVYSLENTAFESWLLLFRNIPFFALVISPDLFAKPYYQNVYIGRGIILGFR